jgi:phosphoribosylformylglycinamidine synthase
MDLSEHLIPEGDLTKSFLLLLGSPNVASKRWIFEQYDTTVRTGTAVRPGGDAGVVRIRGTQRAVAATTDCNGRFVYLRPKRGAMIAVAAAARNLVCVGALPTAITNNLNFGNPLKPHIYFQLREAVLGMAEACEEFETPVTGGNVSLFNETDGRAIYPTPVIGMVGIVEDVGKITSSSFQAPGDEIVLLGKNTSELGGSEYLYVTASLVAGEPPAIDLEGERSLQQAVLEMIHRRLLSSAHDCSEGGLACALAESALRGGEQPLGADVDLDDEIRPVAALFGEAQGRIVVSCAPESTAEVLRVAKGCGVPARKIGVVAESGGEFSIKVRDGFISANLDEMGEAYFGALPGIMDAPPASEA